MATEADISHVRPPEPISITVVRAKNLRGSKGDTVNAMVKVEFGDKPLGESPKVDCTQDSPAEFNFSTNLNCTYDDPVALDEISYKPVVLTVTEVLPKEKRQKEEKTNILGQCCIDLISFVRGATELEQSLIINPVAGSPLETAPPEAPKAELDIKVTVNEPLLDEAQLNDGNLMTVSVGSLYSPPDTWTLTGTQYMYGTALPVPISADKEVPVVFINGVLKPGQDKEIPSKQKKWAVPGSAQGNAVLMPDKFMFSDPIEDEDGDFKAKEDRDNRQQAETEKNRVTWNMERRCYLETSAVRGFQDTIAKNRYWPVEIMRMPQPAAGKGKKGYSRREDDSSISFHGVAFLNLAPLLYPGVKRIRGAFKVVAYTDYCLNEKTKRKTGISDEATKLAFNMLNRASASPAPKKGGKEKEGDKKGDVKKGPEPKEAKKSVTRSNSVLQHSSEMETSQGKSDTGSEAEGQAPVNIEGQQYTEARSYIMMEICLDKPLVPKRPPEALARRVAELIPPRPMFPKRTDGAQRAVEDYHSQVASVANLILDEFRDLFGNELKEGEPQTNEAMEARRQKLIYELNSSGKYFAFKEQLKHSVVKIVREKYLKTSGFDDRQELQTFLSELYVYLIDQMHVSLGRVLALEDQPPVPQPLTDGAQLKHFAREAEVNQNFDLAATYYKERIARDKNDADCWFDFGTFNLYINDITKAEECFKECIAINQKHLQGLLLYGVVCMLSERNEHAETFFEAATCVEPKSILAWTMLGLFYDAVPNEIGAEMAYLEANKLNLAKAAALARAARDEEEEKRKLDEGDMTGETGRDAEGLMQSSEGGLSVPNLEIKAATPDKASPTSARQRNSAGKRESVPGGLSVAGSISKPISAKSTGLAPSRPGSQQRGGSRTPQESEHQEEPPPREPTPVPTSSIFMQAVDWLLEVKAVPFTERALAHELLTCSGGPNASYHISLARLRLQKGEYAEAEENLNEALQFDFQNPDAWSLMGHVKYMTGDCAVARDCYERTLSFVNDASEMHSIYLRLASIYLQEKRFQDAKTTFLMACKKSPSCVSWLGVGIACYRLDELSEAEDALSEANVLNNNDPEVWAYLSLVCLKTNRRLEAEQAYKYAVKLNLEEGPLLAEIHQEQIAYGFGNPAF
ncbi:cilia- and flagella-associated protein 70 isoform X2 [Aplysia californica]|uniref:Cilia- and flagella-associated protein 70 isoform X2 n=1 Tax=Aplysia californica TaxID=6500 RepID=A0ABM1VZQ1_APLCA|nr:cilia- and flagella-associated protein 70 isoform X2 [Aplysia californica]